MLAIATWIGLHQFQEQQEYSKKNQPKEKRADKDTKQKERQRHSTKRHRNSDSDNDSSDDTNSEDSVKRRTKDRKQERKKDKKDKKERKEKREKKKKRKEKKEKIDTHKKQKVATEPIQLSKFMQQVEHNMSSESSASDEEAPVLRSAISGKKIKMKVKKTKEMKDQDQRREHLLNFLNAQYGWQTGKQHWFQIANRRTIHLAID